MRGSRMTSGKNSDQQPQIQSLAKRWRTVGSP
jgi:hypothetical protein